MEQCELARWKGRGRTFLHPEQKDQNPLEAAAEERAWAGGRGEGIQGSVNHGKWGFGSSRMSTAPSAAAKYPSQSSVLRDVPVRSTWCVNLPASLPGEALTDLRKIFCHYGKMTCAYCGPGGRPKAGQVSRGHKSRLGHTFLAHRHKF